jgi:DEAD/DEAH box helicase domain-containing protein
MSYVGLFFRIFRLRLSPYFQIFTNPDMLHITILPQEERWRRFFRKLRFVVVDELHIYSGLFGCHVAFVMRRCVLQRTPRCAGI